MNEGAISPDFLTEAQLDDVKAHDDLLLDDPQLNEEITYRRLTATDYDPETGEETATEVSATFKALGGRVTAREVARAGGLFEVGDHKFLIRQADHPQAPPTKGDEIDRADGTTLQVIFWEEDPLGSLYLVAAREA